MIKTRYFLISVLLTVFGTSNAQNAQTLHHLSSFETGVEGSAEVVAYDHSSQRGFFTNSSSNTLSIISLNSLANPSLFKTIDLSPYGGGPNSVAVKDGIVVVAVQNAVKTSNGQLVFFNANGDYLGAIEAGALPDMVTFSPDGTKIVVANEGEPNDDYTIDPIGSVTIVDITNGLVGAPVTHIDFTSFNAKRAYLENKGVRIFGNNGLSTVAQDIEPEYITITEDNSKAYVNCQENNAFAIIDLNTYTIIDILPLGYKNHLLGTPTVDSYILNNVISNWPSLGTPVYDGGQAEVKLGGYSGLFYDAAHSTSTSMVFYAIPDRGPNADAITGSTVTPSSVKPLRPFKLPNYQAEISKFTFNPTTGAITLDARIPLTRADGSTPITGKGNIPGFDEVPVTYSDAATAYKNADFTDGGGEVYHALPYDAFGGDFEGVLLDKHGNFWLCDEYRPAIYQFDANGKMMHRFVPKGTSLLGSTPMPAGTYGEETLPVVYNNRRDNRGFEAIAYDEVNEIIYAFIQSPIENRSNAVRNKSDVIRILGINANTGLPVSEYVYLLERNKEAGYSASRVDKIGDAFYTGNGKFLVLERDSEGPESKIGKKYVFEIDINKATNILNMNVAKNSGYTINQAEMLGTSTTGLDEGTRPFLLPSGFSQTLVVNRNTANLDPDFASTFGNWDMIALDPSNRYIYIPHEVGTGGGLSRYDRQTGDFVAALKGNNTNVFESDSANWDATNDDFGGVDPATWTPFNTVITAEEWAGNGRLFEWANPLMASGDAPVVHWRNKIPSVSHEGLRFDENGVLYFVDEFNSGSIYKFVPKVEGDLSVGQTFVLKINDYNGPANQDWNSTANKAQSRTGNATWIAMTDINGNALTTADPFDFNSRGGRSAADELNATPYGRPEDLELLGTTLYLATTSEHTVYAIELNSSSTAYVRVLANRNTLDAATNKAAGSALSNPDNLASDANGTLYIIEDNAPGDIWIVKDENNDNVAESIARWASLGTVGAEPTGLISTNNANEFLVCIQHPGSGNDAIWKITAPNSNVLSHSAQFENNNPFLLADGLTQTKIVDRNSANADADFAATFGNWDMISLDPSNRYVYIPLEVGTGAGLTRYDRNTGDFVTAMTGNNSGVFQSNPNNWDLNNDDFGALDPAVWTPHSTVLTAEEWSGNGRLFEWLNPLMTAGTTPNVVWRSNIPSVSHEGIKFDAKGNMYFVDEFNSGSVYKFVPKNVGDLSIGQTFVLKVEAYNGDASKDFNHSSNINEIRTGMASWIAVTDENGVALTSANPFDFTTRGGRTAADELNATPYGRPEDLELVGNMLFLAVTSENAVYSFELLNEEQAMVRIYASQASFDFGTGTAAGSAFAKVDNLAADAFGHLYIVEDNEPGDIWIAIDNDQDGIADSIARWASLGVYGAEPTGLIATNDPKTFLVCIQHPKTGNDALWQITNTSDIINNVSPAGLTLEELSADEIASRGIATVHKYKVLNLPSVGYSSSDKSEGIALLPDHKIAVINDNDFGLAGAGITDNSVLGVISFGSNYGFDASDKDNAINIANHPTLGMYLPDGIKSYTVDGVNYIVTANEGDSRDYDGYSEEERVKDLNLNPMYYPNASLLQADLNIGRLKTTSATGDYDRDGEVEQIYSYGARSFSIFDQFGNLVFDSGDDFAQIVSNEEEELFNEDDGTKDGRSDDKGVEPEAIELATIEGNTYAFIGFERQSAIVVYDITDPKQPEFITYYINRATVAGELTGDIAPEIIHFIPANESPNGQNLLLVGYEVSGSMGIIQVGGELVSISEVVKQSTFNIFPNPLNSNNAITFSETVNAVIYDMNGILVGKVNNSNSFDCANLSSGMYIIQTENHGTKRFLKLH